jgi:NAD(P)-dependent dehydrogenase (short-subunit alcohol dehydrogenase family)
MKTAADIEQRPGRLAGKVAIITGASTGTGPVMAKLFVEQGARVLLSARREPPVPTQPRVPAVFSSGQSRHNCLAEPVDIFDVRTAARMWQLHAGPGDTYLR